MEGRRRFKLMRLSRPGTQIRSVIGTLRPTDLGIAALAVIGTLRPTERRGSIPEAKLPPDVCCFIYGAEGDRTPDLCIANAALSQLSYSPSYREARCVVPTTALRLNVRPRIGGAGVDPKATPAAFQVKPKHNHISNQTTARTLRNGPRASMHIRDAEVTAPALGAAERGRKVCNSEAESRPSLCSQVFLAERRTRRTLVVRSVRHSFPGHVHRALTIRGAVKA